MTFVLVDAAQVAPKIGSARDFSHLEGGTWTAAHGPRARARLQGRAHASQARHRIGEEHRSEAGENEIVLSFKVVEQCVAIHKGNIL